MNALEITINRRNQYLIALDDARNDVPISEDEHYESDDWYETAISVLNDLIEEIQLQEEMK